MTSTAPADERFQLCDEPIHHPRLRAMLESWERDGFIPSHIAGPVLTANGIGVYSETEQAPARRRRVETVGFLGVIPFFALALVMAVSHVGAGPLLLIGVLVAVASPQALRSRGRFTYAPGPTAPRHRAGEASHVRISR